MILEVSRIRARKFSLLLTLVASQSPFSFVWRSALSVILASHLDPTTLKRPRRRRRRLLSLTLGPLSSFSPMEFSRDFLGKAKQREQKTTTTRDRFAPESFRTLSGLFLGQFAETAQLKRCSLLAQLRRLLILFIANLRQRF